MPRSNAICERGTPSTLVAGGKGGRAFKRRLGNQPVYLVAACWCLLSFLAVSSTAAAEEVQVQQQLDDIRGKRAGNVVGLEGGRISLAKFTGMLTSGVHMELAGSEDAFGRLLDHEWEQFSARPSDTRSTFLVCSAPGRANAKRLRELAGADSLVETLYRRKGEILCSFASLDRNTAALVAAEGGASEGEPGTFSLEPLPHLAKLAPAVASDPSEAALLLSSEALASASGVTGAGKYSGVYVQESVGGDRRLGALRGNPRAEKREVSAEHRARILAEAAAATEMGSAGGDRPSTLRLIQDGERGMVDAIEVTLTNHHERRSKSDTENLARRWLSLASDQAALATALKAEHFWSKGQPQEEGDRQVEDGAVGVEETQGEAGAREEEEEEEEETDERAYALAAHEARKRLGWADVLSAVERGQGRPAARTNGTGAEDADAEATVGSCRFDLARFTAAPSGKKVLFHRPHKMATAAAAAASGSGGGGDEGGCLSALLAFVSLQPEAHYVTARRKTATMNLDAAWVSQSGVDGFTPLWDENLQGQDEIIGVADTGLDRNHCHFREDDGDSVEASDWDDPVTDTDKRKVVQYIDFVDDFDEEDGHGTHVAGTLAGAQSGDSAGDDEADGMAFQGKLAVFDFGDSDNFNALTTPDEIDEVMLQPAYDGGARVHSNSWDTVSTEYTALSKEVDEFVYTHQNFLVVFAAGNCGDTTDDTIDNCSVLDEDEGTVLSPAQGKNVVAVGSSESGGEDSKDSDTVSYFSSKGPTIDGRIKPDVVAPGDPNYSASADPSGETCEMAFQTGTSMATPVVAGNGAMARQYFREGWYNTGSKNETLGFDPSAALLKAVLINSATAMTYAGVNPDASTLDVTLGSPPDEHQGFGRVTMINALNINSSVGIYFEDWKEIYEGETIDFEVSLYEDADLDKDLRVTLVWTDPPASVGSTSALIHDLDLVVIAQSTGTEYYPNGGEEADTVNNVEKVVISDTTEGETYTIRVICNDLSESETQSFAFIANGEFIKTNALPTTPDPSDWLDLVDQAAATLFTWKFGAALALGVLACCAAGCMWRSFRRGARHRSKVDRYRREITTGRGGTGRKLRTNSVRPQPFPGPVRHPGELYVAGSGRFQESWRRPGPGSIGGRSMRSMRSEQSARGVLLTGAGAVVPGQSSEGTRPPTPPHEACPECGLQLTDVVQLVNHVETQHGGRATRKKDAGGTGGLKVAEAKVMDDETYRNNVDRNVPVVTVAPSKNAAPLRTGNPYADARAAATAATAAAAVEAKPSSSEKPSSRSPDATHGSRARRAAPGGGTIHATAIRSSVAATAAGASRDGRSPDGARSTSPGISGASSGRSGSSSRPRSGSPAVVSGSSPGRSGTSDASGPSISSSSGGDRNSLPRIRDLSGPDRHGNKAAAGTREGSSPLPRLLSHRRLGGGRDHEGGQTPRGSATPPVRGGVTGRPSSPNATMGGTRRGGSGGGGSRGGAHQKPRGYSAEQGKSSRDGGAPRGDAGGRGHGNGRGQEPAPGFEQPRRGVAKEDSVRSLTRTSSLDRMSALSSRAITRSAGYKPEGEGSASGGGAATARKATEHDEETTRSRRSIRRNASTEDVVPQGQRLTADRLRVLGSGLPENFELPPPVFSPVKASAKEPAYSPVDRERAGELDEDRPVSMTRKFFRQLSK